MIRVQAPPVAGDGGFWYLVSAAEFDPSDFRAVGFTCWRLLVDGVGHFVVRTPDPVTAASDTDLPPLAWAAWGQIPLGRIRGR